VFIESNLITFRALESEDCQTFYAWANDREVTQFSLSSYAYPQSKADISSWLASINQNTKTISFAICCQQTGSLIGYAGIAAISTLNRCGEFFILIGDKNYWGKGIGTEATQLITEYAFKTIGLHRVELTAYATNPAAIRAYEKAGYQHEGVKRQSGFRNGEFVDKVQMAALCHEWSLSSANQ